ncbi:hypothetical protein DPX16_21707 [Anabarilius grahami]|uniref:Retrotransposon gag domain-containing protein n=1 Tax=Anabarilius grahami TaxID=495550 RepID=A0A3N0YK39_ANAGA|nr:hypothetical protein DPX16_21707 [Anabarilius grahami]
MGIFIVPVPSRNRQRRPTAEDRIWTAKQDGHPLEKYVEEFTELSCKVSWPDAILNTCFLRGLDEDTVRYIEPECIFSLVESINLILFLNGSEFEVEEVQMKSYSPRPVLSEIQAAWPVHQPPISSTYRSSGHSLVVLSDPKPPKRRASTKPRRPKKTAAASPESPVKPAAQPEPSPKEAHRILGGTSSPSLPRARSSLPRARSNSPRARSYFPRASASSPRACSSLPRALSGPPTWSSPHSPTFDRIPQEHFLGGHVPVGGELMGGVSKAFQGSRPAMAA